MHHVACTHSPMQFPPRTIQAWPVVYIPMFSVSWWRFSFLYFILRAIAPGKKFLWQSFSLAHHITQGWENFFPTFYLPRDSFSLLCQQINLFWLYDTLLRYQPSHQGLSLSFLLSSPYLPHIPISSFPATWFSICMLRLSWWHAIILSSHL